MLKFFVVIYNYGSPEEEDRILDSLNLRAYGCEAYAYANGAAIVPYLGNSAGLSRELGMRYPVLECNPVDSDEAGLGDWAKARLWEYEHRAQPED